MKKKYYFKLLAKGYTTTLLGKKLKDPMDHVYIDNEMKYVVATNEHIARSMIQTKLKRKWQGFVILGEIPIETMENNSREELEGSEGQKQTAPREIPEQIKQIIFTQMTLDMFLPLGSKSLTARLAFIKNLQYNPSRESGGLNVQYAIRA